MLQVILYIIGQNEVLVEFVHFKLKYKFENKRLGRTISNNDNLNSD